MPTPHNSPGFVSFSDYLNANQGSLAQERDQALAGAKAQFGTVQSDLDALKANATAAGQQAGAAAPNNGQWTDTGARHRDPATGATSGELSYVQGQNPTYSPDTTGLDTSQFQGDLSHAQDNLTALTAGHVGGKTSWESGLIGADNGYQQGLSAMQPQLNGFSNYLDQISSAGQSGFQQGLAGRTPPAFHPGVPQTAPGDPTTVNTDPGTGNTGPAGKPEGVDVWDPTAGTKRHLQDAP